MLAYYETTTHLHELPGPDNSKRMLSYIVIGHPLDAADPPEQTIIYHHGWPSCRYEALALHAAALSRKWRIIAVDRYGVGKSSFNAEGTSKCLQCWCAMARMMSACLQPWRGGWLSRSLAQS